MNYNVLKKHVRTIFKELTKKESLKTILLEEKPRAKVIPDPSGLIIYYNITSIKDLPENKEVYAIEYYPKDYIIDKENEINTFLNSNYNNIRIKPKIFAFLEVKKYKTKTKASFVLDNKRSGQSTTANIQIKLNLLIKLAKELNLDYKKELDKKINSLLPDTKEVLDPNIKEKLLSLEPNKLSLIDDHVVIDYHYTNYSSSRKERRIMSVKGKNLIDYIKIDDYIYERVTTNISSLECEYDINFWPINNNINTEKTPITLDSNLSKIDSYASIFKDKDLMKYFYKTHPITVLLLMYKDPYIETYIKEHYRENITRIGITRIYIKLRIIYKAYPNLKAINKKMRKHSTKEEIENLYTLEDMLPTSLFYEYLVIGDNRKELRDIFLSIKNDPLKSSWSYMYKNEIEILDFVLNLKSKKANLEYIKNLGRNNFIKQKPAIETYIDYINMAKEMNLDLENKEIARPRYIKPAHDKMELMYNAYKILKSKNAFKKIKTKLQNIIIDNLCFKIPESENEVINEGVVMSNCIASYADRFIKGETLLVFVKEIDEEGNISKDSKYDLELRLRDNKLKLVQAKASANREVPKEAKEIINKYVKLIESNTELINLRKEM